MPTPAHRAFELFTDRLAAWWPPEYTWAQQRLDTIVIEPRQGGRCYERGPQGFECDWGRVLVCDPPRRLVFSWQIAPDRTPQPDPERASEVEVRFEPAHPDGGGGTRVGLEHRGFGRHGEGGDAYRAGLASPQGWPLLLERFAAAAGR